MASSRPVRNRTQPSRNKDNVELNNQVIERYDALQGTRQATNGSTNYAKILYSFVKSINQKYLSSIAKKELQKKDQPSLKNRQSEGAEQAEWGPTKDKKKYTLESNIKGYSKTAQSSLPQQERQIDRNNQVAKAARISRAPLASQKPQSQQQPRIQSKQPRKATVQVLQPPASREPPKPFKRASYHIGIAYTIYMDQMRSKNSNLTDLNNCDPTFHSRKLRIGHPQQ